MEALKKDEYLIEGVVGDTDSVILQGKSPHPVQGSGRDVNFR